MKTLKQIRSKLDEMKTNDIMKQFGNDREWIGIVKKYKKDIEAFVKSKGRKGMSMDAEEAIIDWAVENDYMGGPDDMDSLDDFYDEHILGESTIREAKGMNIIVQVKGFKGNLKNYDKERQDSGDFDLGSLLDIDTDSPDTKYSGSTVTYSFDEDETGYTAGDIKSMFQNAVKKSKDFNKYSKYTADMIKKNPNKDPSDFPGNKQLDDFYIGAHYNKSVTPGKPFMYSVKLK